MDPNERNDQSFVFLLDTRGSVPSTLRLYPTNDHPHADPACAARSAQKIAERMQRLSTQLGTPSSWIEADNVLEIPIGPGLTSTGLTTIAEPPPRLTGSAAATMRPSRLNSIAVAAPISAADVNASPAGANT